MSCCPDECLEVEKLQQIIDELEKLVLVDANNVRIPLDTLDHDVYKVISYAEYLYMKVERDQYHWQATAYKERVAELLKEKWSYE